MATAVSCAVCQLTCSSERCLAEHIRGRGHQINLDRQRAAARNVFVRGFPPQTTLTSDLLTDLFKQYGEITKVFLTDTYAIVTFKSESHATAALGEPPLLEGKPLVVKPRYYKPPNKSKPLPMDVQKTRSCLPVPVEGLELIKSATTLSGQLELVSYHTAMTDVTIRGILHLSSYLETGLQTLFPHCLLLPFGSVVTGLGTLTSDADLSLLLNPQHMHLMAPHVYYPPNVLELSQQPLSEPPSPTDSIGSTHSTPERPIRSQDALKVMASLVRSTAGCERVFTIRSARCPVVRFYHRPSSLHVDLSLDNGLGVHNSRLLAAYCRFDLRVTPLIRATKLWMREVGQRRVNSYATSLMVIHSLQHTSPPVLPCLQDLGPWQRNMEWFKQHTPSDHVIIESWSCDFTPIESLKPSNNTESLGALFVHFFRYYSTFQFPSQVVAVHSNTPLSHAQANEGLVRPMSVGSALVVQDPFDHSHNICKNVSKQIFSELTAQVTGALQYLSGESPTLLELYTMQPLPPPRHSNKYISLHFNTIAGLLKETGLVPTDLDLTNQMTQQCLYRFIAHQLVSLIKSKFGFQCEPVLGHVTPPPGHVTPPTGHVTPPTGHVIHSDNPIEDMTIEHSEHTEDDDTNEPVTMDTVARKRHISDSPPPAAEPKRMKSTSPSVSALDLLHSIVDPLPNTSTYTCIAYENTWIGTRQRRRDATSLPDGGDMATSLPVPDTPLLEILLRVSGGRSVGRVLVHAPRPHHKAHADNWFSVFKPLVINY